MEPSPAQSKGEPTTHRGRTPDPTRDVALRGAALELLAEIGYDRLTMDAVAGRARSSKNTIYRRWPGKAELVVDALHSLKGTTSIPDTGSLRGDLEAIAQGATSADNRFDSQLMMGLITALAHDGDLRRVFRERLIDPSHATLKVVFERAISRGEVAQERNLDLLVSLFPALMLQHLLKFGEVPGPHFAQQVIDDVILPLASAPSASTPHSPTTS
jgi:AcrR family transcriptional regulator